MVNYSNGKVYGIFDNDVLLYIGSTCNALSKRLAEHRSGCKRNLKMPLYDFVKTRNGQWEGLYIELIENCSCENKEQLNRREGELIRERKPLYNKAIPTRTKKEWVEENRDIVMQKKKEWYERNKEVVAEKKKKYREEHKEAIYEYNKNYVSNHKEAVNDYMKQYAEQNRERLNEYRREYYRDKRHQTTAE